MKRSTFRKLMFTAAGCLAASSGCTPGQYRKQADQDVACLLKGVAKDPRWSLHSYSAEPSHESRMYSPYCPDHPPMPPDDAASHKLMHCVDKKKGYPCWHVDGDTPYVENPEWLAYLPTDDRGVVVFNLADSIRTSLVNSPQYQNEVEDIYLSALDVSFERFRFDVQFFAGESLTYTADGALRNGDGQSSSELALSTFPAGRDVELRRLFSTGGELVVNFANSIVWQFSGPNTTNYNSLVDFSLVQPLLRAGGRDVVLERLTIAERTLLANVRQMERYRQSFATGIATGRDPGTGPSRRGGFFGGSGLEGFSGIGGGGFGRVGNVTGGGGGTNDGVAGGAGAARAGGFLGLLQTQQEIRNLEANVFALRDSLERLEVLSQSPKPHTPEALRSLYQVELARQALHNASSRLITGEQDYAAQVDNFKIRLGLPPDLDVEIKDPLLDRFQLIDQKLIDLQAAGDRVLVSLQPAPTLQATYGAGLEQFVAELDRSDRALSAAISQHAQASLKLADLRRDMQTLAKAAPERRAWLDRLSKRYADRANEFDAQLLSVSRFNHDLAALQKRYTDMEASFAHTHNLLRDQSAAVSAELAKRRAEQGRNANGDAPQLLADRKASFDRTSELIRQLSDDIAEMWIIEAKAQLESIVLVPVDMKSEDALAIASRHRHDWMNARAAVVDAWRLIRFNADNLESDLDIVLSGDMGTVGGDNPLKFDAAAGRLRAGLEFDAPLTRLSERNNYRQSLIEYSQARRNYYQFVDRVNQGLRNTLRTIELNQINFELRRSAVHTALTQVDLARKQLVAPLRPNTEGPVGQPAATSDTGSSGELGRDLVNALADLTQVQNDFLSVWLNYHVQRMNLDLDLGTMQVDGNGSWVEPKSYDMAALAEEICPADRGVIAPPAHRDRVAQPKKPTDEFPSLDDNDKGNDDKGDDKGQIDKPPVPRAPENQKIEEVPPAEIKQTVALDPAAVPASSDVPKLRAARSVDAAPKPPVHPPQRVKHRYHEH
jgi:hypothetical protein